MGIVSGLKFKKSGAAAIALQELEPGDQFSAAVVAGLIGRNRLINGNFDFAQEAVLGNVSNAAPYTADQWMVSSSAVGITCNWGIGAPAVGEIEGATRFLGYNVVAGAGSAWIGQRIEGVQTLANGKATVSFWMRSGVAGKKVGLSVQQVFGSGGSSTVQTDGAVITLTTTFTKYTYTFDVPTIVGKTYGANHHLFLLFFLCDGSYFGGQLANQVGLFELAQVQFEKGDTATLFDFRDLGLELSLCQRYWEKSYSDGIYPGTASQVGYASALVATSGYFLSSAPTFKAAKRTIPAVTTYRYDNGATGQMTEYGTTGSLSAGRPANVTNLSTYGFETRSDGTATAGNPVRYHWVANARL